MNNNNNNNINNNNHNNTMILTIITRVSVTFTLRLHGHENTQGCWFNILQHSTSLTRRFWTVPAFYQYDRYALHAKQLSRSNTRLWQSYRSTVLSISISIFNSASAVPCAQVGSSRIIRPPPPTNKTAWEPRAVVVENGTRYNNPANLTRVPLE